MTGTRNSDSGIRHTVGDALRSGMQLAPFLLDQWISQKFAADPPIEFDLASSTGPVWTLRELLELGGDMEGLLDTRLFYTPPAGSSELREELARMESVQPEHVLVTTGGAEALLILLHSAAEPGANVVLPNPRFPMNEAVAESLGLEVRRYTLRPEDGFQIDMDEIRRLTDRHTKFVLVNSPHNPTGAVAPESEMEALHDFCVDRGVQIVFDEVISPDLPRTADALRRQASGRDGGQQRSQRRSA